MASRSYGDGDKMSLLGQKAKYSLGADVFRFALDNGHCVMQSALRICARTGSDLLNNRVGTSKERQGYLYSEHFHGLQV